MNDGIAVAVAVGVTATPLWRSIGTHVVTVVHEGGHALVVGRSSGSQVGSIRVNRDGTGSTKATNRVRDGGAFLMAGYLTPPAVGLGALAAAHVERGGAALMVLLGGVVLVLVSVRNVFGLAVVFLLSAGLYLAVHHADGPTQDAVLLVFGWTLLLGSVRDTMSGLVHGLGDAQALSKTIGLPARLWVIFFALTACAAVYCAAWLTVTYW
ncbi:MAG TPA: M50 family metallopeptidase [Mycobacteriales bacterium]